MPTRRPPARPGPGHSPQRPGPLARARNYLGRRLDPLTSVFLVVPLFLVYQLGVLTQMRCGPAGCAWAGNGVDFITANLMSLTGGSRAAYALFALATAAALMVGALWARRRARLHPKMFVPVLLESALYASLVGPVIASLQRSLTLGAPGQSNFLGDVIASCGAGLHEELIFRVVAFAGGAWVLRRLGMRPLVAVLVAAVGSSAVFSAVHHLGALGEPFTAGAFVFRFLAGLVFAAIYRVRGFAIAAWTHALYDVWVFFLQRTVF